MIYNEEYIGRAVTIYELMDFLTKVPIDATIEVSAPEHSADCEVWYDKNTNTVILK